MNLLVVVADKTQVPVMQRILSKAGVQADVAHVYQERQRYKPPMKELRQFKPELDKRIRDMGYDFVLAAGETAARLVLDTSAVNINKLRGRDFEYSEGVKKPGKKKADES